MATALSATGRITIPYTVTGRLHKTRMYVRNPQVGGTSYNINSRTTDANDTDWAAAAQRLAYYISYMLATGTTVSDAYLEKIQSGLWITVATATVTLTNLNATAGPGWGATWVFRDVLFKKVKIVIEEGNVGVLFHTAALSGLTGNYASCKAGFVSTAGNPADPYFVMVGRGNQYLNTAPFVGLTTAPNRKIRRARGLT